MHLQIRAGFVGSGGIDGATLETVRSAVAATLGVNDTDVRVDGVTYNATFELAMVGVDSSDWYGTNGNESASAALATRFAVMTRWPESEVSAGPASRNFVGRRLLRRAEGRKRRRVSRRRVSRLRVSRLASSDAALDAPGDRAPAGAGASAAASADADVSQPSSRTRRALPAARPAAVPVPTPFPAPESTPEPAGGSRARPRRDGG